MKDFYKKAGFFFLFLSVSILLSAQKQSFKSLLQELQTIQKQLVPDERVTILNIEFKDTLQPVVVILGETNFPEAKAQIIQWLNDQQVAFVDSIRLLPDISLGDKTWALATLSVSNLRALPDDASELVSQALMGTPLKVLDIHEKWYRVQTPDQYIGWMSANEMQLFNQNEIDQWKHSNRYLFHGISGYLVNAPNKKGDVVSDLVLDDLFEVEAIVKGYLKIRLPDGRNGYVRKSDCISFQDWCSQVPNALSILSVAKQMMGSPYLWGGTSSKAVDCSGFVKLAYFSQGVILARDASQQARYGQHIDFKEISNLQSGDLLFFGRSAQRITHVGIYLGKSDFIHSSGKVHVSSINPADPKYVATRNYVAACRILNSLDTKGIVRVKNHPWY